MPHHLIRRTARCPLAFTLALSLAGGLVSHCLADDTSGPPRTQEQIIKDIDASPIPNYPFYAQVDPRYHDQMARELTAPLQRNVDLNAELAKASPAYRIGCRQNICVYQAELALLGDDAALKSLSDQSNSPVASDALSGTVGLLMMNWWGHADADKQKQELTQFEQLAKASPDDGLLCVALLNVARNGAASDALGNAARDIVEADLTSPQAKAYKVRPDKLGRPFVIRAQAIDHKMISTADWRGKVIVIDFWATWCPPCRASLPDLIKLYQDNHAQGLEVLGVSNDYAISDLTTFLAANKDMAWPQLFSPSPPDQWNRLSHSMGVTEIPTEFYIDRNGILRDIEINHLRTDLVAQYLAEPVNPDLPTTKPSPVASDAPTPDSSGPQTQMPPPAPTIQKPLALPSDEDLAKPMLSQARLLIANNQTELATNKLKSLIDQYPKTASADQARTLLAQINSGQ